MEPQSRPDSPQIKLPKKPTGNFRLTKDRKISEPLVRSTAIDSKDVGTILMKTCDSAQDQIPLRSSTLTLSKYDEKMPSRASRSALMQKPSSHLPSHHRRFSHTNIRHISKEDSLTHRLNHTEESSLEPVISGGAVSVLNELVRRRRNFLIFLLAVFGILFVTGCIISIFNFLPNDRPSIAGQFVGILLVFVGFIGCLVVSYFQLKPDQELKHKIEMRERMFSTFRKIVSEPQSRTAIVNPIDDISKQAVLQGAGGDK